MYKKLDFAWASSLLGFLSICFIPIRAIPFLLYKYGEGLRRRRRRRRRRKLALKNF
jgi:DHA1 family multidrug resistance protein-like MFS transporter